VLHRIISLVVAVLLAVFALPWCWLQLRHQWLLHIANARDPFPDDPMSVAIGLLVGCALVWWKRPNWFIHTTIHELCHLLMCMLLLVPVHSFRASRGQGGEVVHDAAPDALRSTLISIAPYVVPLLLVPCLLAAHLLPEGRWHALASGLAGFAAVHHVQGLFHNVRLNFWGKDSDLVKIGRPLSLVLIVGALALVAAWTISVLW
jgi:hypothetical protein